MTFTKNNLAAAVAGAFIAGVGSQSAFAAIDLDSTANAGIKIASETVIGTAGVNIVGSAFDSSAVLNANAIPDATDVRVTITLSGGTFTGAGPTLTLVPGSTAISGINIPTFVIFTGGGTADSSVTFNSNAGANDIPAASEWLLSLGSGVTVTDQSTVTATWAVQVADNFGVIDLGTGTGTVATWGPLLALAADPSGRHTTSRIDVTQDSLQFSNTASPSAINVGGWATTAASTGTSVVSVAGSAITYANIIANQSASIAAANGYASFNQFSGTSPVAGGGMVTGGIANSCVFSTSDSTLATCPTYAVTAAEAIGGHDVVLTNDGGTANTVRIQETSLAVTVGALALNTAPAYDPSSATGTVTLMSLARNGSSTRLSFALTPDGSYPMFIRVVNPSSIDGPVTLTLINDDGDSVTFDLTSVEGGPAGDLPAGGSTGLLTIEAVFAAAQAEDSTFDLGATNKLRIEAVAEFGTTGSTTGVVMGAFSVSSDGTSFNMLTDASN